MDDKEFAEMFFKFNICMKSNFQKSAVMIYVFKKN
jgi:hypothetical protein